MNRPLKTVIVAPMTTQGKPYPSRVACVFQGRDNFIVLDQLRTVDKTRLVKRLGKMGEPSANETLNILAEMFSP